jgi:hypothetical protein
VSGVLTQSNPTLQWPQSSKGNKQSRGLARSKQLNVNMSTPSPPRLHGSTERDLGAPWLGYSHVLPSRGHTKQRGVDSGCRQRQPFQPLSATALLACRGYVGSVGSAMNNAAERRGYTGPRIWAIWLMAGQARAGSRALAHFLSLKDRRRKTRHVCKSMTNISWATICALRGVVP